MSDMKHGYCACCGYPVSYFKYAGNVKCIRCGATTIPQSEKQHNTATTNNTQ